MEERKEKLIDLIRLNGDIASLEAELNKFPWDWGNLQGLYVMEGGDILNAVALLNEGIVNAAVIERWANAIECREDIDLENDTVQEVIFELANPILYGDLSEDHLMKIKEMLRQNR